MATDDETRVLPLYPDLSRLLDESSESRDAETPCVGVVSVGDTHFGQTQAVMVQATAARPSRPLVSEPTHSTERRRARELVRSSRRGFPRPLALALGAAFGVTMAVFLLLVENGGKERPEEQVHRTEVIVLAVTPEGEGLEEVPVQVENQVVMTDPSGVARFSEVKSRGGLSVRARCPEGHSGRELVRQLPRSVVQGTPSWNFEIVCQPDFIDVVLAVEVNGCGDMKIWVDGVERGTTQGGKLRLSRRIHQDEVVEVRAEPEGTPCELDQVRHVALSLKKPDSRVVFEGVPQPPTRRQFRRNDSRTSSRPYRL